VATEKLPDHVRAKVVGAMPVRDSFSKESIPPGGVVRLVARRPGDQNPPPGSVLVEALVAGGNIEVLTDKAEKTA
jgi:hypothetical protein